MNWIDRENMKVNKKRSSSATKAEGLPNDIPINIEQEGAAKEIGGPRGLEPTRFGDWEKNGRCSDF